MYIKKIQTLSQEVIEKNWFINQRLDTVPNISRTDELLLADLHNLMDVILSNQLEYKENYFSFFRIIDPDGYLQMLKSVKALLIRFELKIKLHQPQFQLN